MYGFTRFTGSFWSVAESIFFPKTWMKVGKIAKGESFFCRDGNTNLGKTPHTV